jgi:hypothetical protein
MEGRMRASTLGAAVNDITDVASAWSNAVPLARTPTPTDKYGTTRSNPFFNASTTTSDSIDSSSSSGGGGGRARSATLNLGVGQRERGGMMVALGGADGQYTSEQIWGIGKEMYCIRCQAKKLAVTDMFCGGCGLSHLNRMRITQHELKLQTSAQGFGLGFKDHIIYKVKPESSAEFAGAVLV